ncbi:hypothetical protein JR316_0005179 [Psilocybe cubensis]|uniref:Uncharacterized protein n=2 Tax=Psilocybe cubensis TaxID=181762 RepID=A0ACB8H7B9_PSICU|nr:hypothetical protein JR316_0005179 [Psilocybe cubensis]KAH9483079.1 hypothetical protein JR316_0005179 [Psilocybe cubensis]
MTIWSRSRKAARLPQELLDAIVDCVASKGDKCTLRTCNATSWLFRPRAQKRLFEDIQLVVDDNVLKRMENLRQLLDSNPALLKQMHSFKVSVRGVGNLVPLLRWLKIGRESPGLLSVLWDLKAWLKAENSFLWLLHTISATRVEKFSFVLEEAYLNWTSLNDETQNLFLSLQSSSRVKRLQFVNIINVPPSITSEG